MENLARSEQAQSAKVQQKADTKSNFGKWGWSTIILCAIAYFFSGSLGTDGLNIYVPALVDANGFDRATLLSFATYGGWVGIIAALIYGNIAMKKGSKLILIPTLVVAGITFISMGYTKSIAIACLSMAILSICTAGFGTVAPNNIMNTWFPTKKGIALGWATMGFPMAT